LLNIIHIYYLIIISSTSGPERIVIGIVGAILIITILAIIDSGITSKKERNRNRLQKNLNRLTRNINELENLHRQGILNKKEYINKTIELEKKRIDLIVEQELRENEKYQKILDAFKNGLINENEKNEKIKLLKEIIRRNIK
jgi:hypothetical protein